MSTKRKLRRRRARVCDGLLVGHNEMLLDGRPGAARLMLVDRAITLGVTADWLLRYLKYKAE